jgi:hypothetical protein
MVASTRAVESNAQTTASAPAMRLRDRKSAVTGVLGDITNRSQTSAPEKVGTRTRVSETENEIWVLEI